MTASAIYSGSVRHRRYAERHHQFRYGLAMAYIDLDELPRLLGGLLVRRRPGLVRFRRDDYLGDPSRPLSAAVRDFVEERTGARPQGPIRLLANLRSAGHCFNPVSFYYCFEPGGGRVEAVVAEVTNTPWGERHAYAIRRDDDGVGRVLRGGADKALHVSPFLGMEHHYELSFGEPGRTLSVHIENHTRDGVAFDATLALERRELTRASLARATARYPAATIRLLGLIYLNGIRLKLKGVTVHPHPGVSSQ